MKANYYMYPFEQCKSFLKNNEMELITKQICVMHYKGYVCQGSGGGKIEFFCAFL